MPRFQFSTILSAIKDISNVQSQDTLIKSGIQMALDRATAFNLPYLNSKGIITTVATYETGTIEVNNGSAAVVGTTTAFTSAMVGRKLRVEGDNAFYVIKSVADANNLTLEVVYQGDTDTEATFLIFKDEYKLPADLDVYKVMRQIQDGVALIGIPDTAFDVYEPTPTSEGNPNFQILIGSQLDENTTGTLSGSVNTSTLTGVGTSWLSVEGLSAGTRITIGANVYTVKSVDSNTQITIYDRLVSAATGASFILHLDNLIVQFFQIPDIVQHIYFRYQRIAAPLVNDQDIPDFPEKYQYVLITGGLIWAWMTKDKTEATKQEALFQAQIENVWKRIGNINRNVSLPRSSQDDLFFHRRRFNLPAGYNVPIPYNRS